MKKVAILLIVLVILAMPMAALAGQPPKGEKGISGPSGNSNTAHIELWPKDQGDWSLITDGAWGKMKYNLEGATCDFVFNGHDLEVGYDYTLIYYPDLWPGAGLICLGSGIVNDEGNIHLAASVATGDLTDAKIWLILSADVDCDSDSTLVTGWNPTEYLFEYDLITFDAD